MPLRVGCRADDADKHKSDITSLLYCKEKLYSGGDDGKIIAWAPDLTKTAEVQSNVCSVYSITASDDTLYSCSNEGTIKGFELGCLKEKVLVFKDERTEFWKVLWANNMLYSGDNESNIKMWKDNKLCGVANVAEQVQDLAVVKNLVFAVKDQDVVVNEITLIDEKLHHNTRNTIMGRAPFALIEDHLIAFISRSGTDILIHQIGSDCHVTEFAEIKCASDKIINALVGANWNGQNVLFSGGWDKQIKKWIIEGNSARLECTLNAEMVVNAIALGDAGEIYVGGSDGHMIRIEVE